MTYDEFVGQVQHRARLASGGEAIHAIHATLSTLGQRLYGNEARHLAAQLPEEIGSYLTETDRQESFSLRDFYQRVAEREHAEMPDAVYHAHAVLSVVNEAVSPGEIADACAQLPEEFRQLFTWEEGQQRRSA